MTKIIKIALLLMAICLVFLPDVYGQFGVARRTARRTTVVVAGTVETAAAATSAAAAQKTAAAQQQTAAAQQQAAVAQQQAAAAEQNAAIARQESAVAQGLLPLGTIVYLLPSNCAPVVINNVEYHRCGVNYYKAAFQGSDLVYVTTKPN